MLIIKKQWFYALAFAASINIYVHPYAIFNHALEALTLAKPYLPENPIIFEAGAYDGTDSIIMSKAWPEGKLYIFEPIQQLYEKIVQKTKPYTNITTYPTAIGDYNGSAQFYISEWADNPGIPSGSSSVLKPKEHLNYAPQVLFKQEITVPIMTIDAWAEEHGVDHIDFMWLDMQGYELNALKASPKIMKTVKVILTEVEMVEAYEGQYLFTDVKKWLEEQGFTMIAKSTYPDWFCDVLFVRK